MTLANLGSGQLRRFTSSTRVALAACFLLLVSSPVAAKKLAFPGADGFGRFSEGGRGGKVYVVTSLEDHPEFPKKGSFRYAIESRGPRTIVFAVSGVIRLKADLRLTNLRVTIAGQTSPGGIVITGGAFMIVGADDVIVRYLRFRRGKGGEDSFGVYRSRDIIIDHCSFSWAEDEVASLYNNRRLTMQHSIIAQGLAGGEEGDDGGFGGIWGGAGVSFHHNLMASNSSRNPRVNGYRMGMSYAHRDEFVDVRANVIYNWGWSPAYGNEAGRLNLANNYYRPGPASLDTDRRRIFVFYPHKANGQFGTAWVQDNVYDLGAPLTLKEGQGLSASKVPDEENAQVIAGLLQESPFPGEAVRGFKLPTYVQSMDARAAYRQLVEAGDVGANRVLAGVLHDEVDAKVLANVRTRQGRLMRHEREVISSWAAYDAALKEAGSAVTRRDRDRDGMDDTWERERGVRKPNRYQLSKEYTNLEVYLNELAARPVP